jgi:hypothetical protein
VINVAHIKTRDKEMYLPQDLYLRPSTCQFLFKKNSNSPIISIEHFVDIGYLIGNNNETGVGINNFEKKTCRHKNNVVKNSSLPGGTWL